MKTKVEKFLMNSVFPPVCYGCGSFGVEYCSKCIKGMRTSKFPICLRCGKETTLSFECGCVASRGIGVASAIWQYEGGVRKAIFEYKYLGRKEAIAPLFKYMRPFQLAKLLAQVSRLENPILVPVPIHDSKLRARGFDQSRIIANLLSALLSVDVVAKNAVVRIKKSPPQAHIRSREEREKNVMGSFFVNHTDLLKRRSVIVVDDVLTTGSTIRALISSIQPHSKNIVESVVVAHEDHPI